MVWCGKGIRREIPTRCQGAVTVEPEYQLSSTSESNFENQSLLHRACPPNVHQAASHRRLLGSPNHGRNVSTSHKKKPHSGRSLTEKSHNGVATFYEQGGAAGSCGQVNSVSADSASSETRHQDDPIYYPHDA